MIKPEKCRAQDAASPVIPDSLSLKGITGRLARNIANHWLIGLRESNPAILAIFRDRDVLPYRDLLSWSGEFAGKHITGAYYIYQLTRSQALYDDILCFIDEMLTYQDTDGYLGCFAKDCHLTGAFSQNPAARGCTWDAWNHYHIMVGLLLWHDLTGNEAYWNAVLRIADLFISKFYDGKPTLASTGSTEMNLAPYHIFALLYEITGQEKYLYFAKKIEGDFSCDDAGDYINCSLRGIEFYQCPKPRWESLHAIMGIAEMYPATGEPCYLRSAWQITQSILKTDVHNTGAFSTDEQAIGNPYKNSNIETCCMVAFNALAARMWNITGDTSLLDFLELSHYNAAMGAFSPSGKWSTYSSPMEGEKRANYDSIHFQSRSGSPQLNCCSVNAPRGVGEIAMYMFTKNNGVLCLNFFESYEATFDGLTIICESVYPAPGFIRITVTGKEQTQPIAVRIPHWSKRSTVTVNGEKKPAESGKYTLIGDTWDGAAEILICFDFTPYTEKGAMEYEGKSSIYCGPVLYGADSAHNPTLDVRILPAIRMESLCQTVPEVQKDGSILWKAADVALCDFYHLGCDGSLYRTWLNVV